MLGVNNFEVKVVVGESVEDEGGAFDDGTLGVAVVFLSACVLEGEGDSGKVSIGVDDFVLAEGSGDDKEEWEGFVNHLDNTTQMFKVQDSDRNHIQEMMF